MKDESLSKIRFNKNDIPGCKDAVGLSLKCFNNLNPSFLEYTFYESLSTLPSYMARPFLEVCYDRVVPRQQLLNTPLHCVPFQNEGCLCTSAFYRGNCL